MALPNNPKLFTVESFLEHKKSLPEDYKLVFTNGCFDILHPGHVDLLQRARALGDGLIMGLNSDASVRRLNKGPERPLNNEEQRAFVLSGLECIDFIIIFDEDTPFELVDAVRPQVLVKGGDWPVPEIVGGDIVQADGGEVLSLKLLEGYSTTGLVERIKSFA